ncbi:MAG: hypothetical protein GY727_06620, partial [Gammaproteobacteria bacterium]|nr:hypothetical protein [Gammaproteobacteria bacterium]
GVVGMSKMPDSGTGSRFASMVPGGIGGVAGFALSGGNPWVTAAGAAAPALMGRGMLTQAGRNYLGNQLIRPDKGLIEGLRTLPPGILAGQQK